MLNTERAAIIVFAKSPVPGDVKTRLQPVLSEDEAAELYTALILDTTDACRRLDVDLRLYVGGEVASFPEGLVPRRASVHRQQGEGLGARMAHAFSETLGGGCERAVIVGTDYPTLRASVLRQAFRTLGPGNDRYVPIGLSEDGGYYLLGLSEPFPSIFEMSYSHDQVAAQTLRTIVRGGHVPVLLPTARDIDRPEDLRRLAVELRERPDRAPHSYRALTRLGWIETERSEIEFSTD